MSLATTCVQNVYSKWLFSDMTAHGERAAGRILFASWQLYALAHGASGLIWSILLFEVLWAIAQLAPVSSPSRA